MAETIVRNKCASLENHALGDIQGWRNTDESIVSQLRSVLTTATELPETFAEGIYAAHAVAAAVTGAVAQGGDIPLLFDRMLAVLKAMHDGNDSWGPLFVAHPGDIAKHVAYNNTQ